MKINTTNWQKIGQTANAEFFEIEPGLLAVVPAEGCTDDGTTAQASVDTQLAYLRNQQQAAGIIIFMDPIAEQTVAARTVYREAPDVNFQKCFALVGGTFFGRAVGSVFLGLSRPKAPTQMFGTLEEAIAWCRTHVKK